MRPLLKTAEAAKLLSLSKHTLTNMRHRGNGPTYVKLGKSVRYRPEDLESYLATQNPAETDQPLVQSVLSMPELAAKYEWCAHKITSSTEATAEIIYAGAHPTKLRVTAGRSSDHDDLYLRYTMAENDRLRSYWCTIDQVMGWFYRDEIPEDTHSEKSLAA